MAKEIRKITFNLSELGDVVNAYANKTGEKVQIKPLLKIEEQAGNRIVLHHETGKPSVFMEKQMIIAILLYCQLADIPIPKNAKKVIKTEDRNLSLIFQV